MNSNVPSFRSERYAVTLLILVLILIGCNSSSNPVIPPGPPVNTAELWRFFPLNEGDKYVYETATGERQIYTTMTVQAMEGGEYGIFNVDRGTTTQEYAFWSGNNLRRSHENNPNSGSIELLGPLVEGQTWRKATDNTQTSTYYSDATVLDTAYTVDVPAGTFETVAVRSISVSDYPNVPRSVDTSYTYYARDVGVVKWSIAGLIVELTSYTPAEPVEP